MEGHSCRRHLPPTHLAQADWDEVCPTKDGDKGSFWVSYRPSVHVKALYDEVRVSRESGTLHCESEELSARVEWKRKQLILAPKVQSQAKGTLQAPSAAWKQIHPKQQILSMDISPGGELGVSGGSDSTIRVWHTKDGVMRRDLKGHIGDINLVKWFPSGKVVLSGAQDLQLKIWDAMTGQCAASLKGHAGAITGAAMIDRGRNLLCTKAIQLDDSHEIVDENPTTASSRDGTARLWDVPTQTTIATFGAINAGNYANSCCLQVGQSDKNQENASQLLLVAKEDGSLLGWDVRTRNSVLQWRASEALNCCLSAGEHVWAGGQEGTSFHWDLRTQNLMETLQRSMAPVLSIAVPRDAWTPALSSTDVPLVGEFCNPAATATDGVSAESRRPAVSPGKTLWIGTNGGLCFEWNIESSCVTRDLTGPNCDPVHALVALNDCVFTACGDGAIRKYRNMW